jgi:hypothetical protein
VATAIVVLAGVLFHRRREGRWLRDVILGALGVLVSTALAAGLAFGVIRVLDSLVGTPTMGASPCWPSHPLQRAGHSYAAGRLLKALT